MNSTTWEPYLVGRVLSGEQLTIYGYGGFQVRNVIHASDLAALFYEFVKNPNSGEVYNVGGGRNNFISLFEANDLIEDVTGKCFIHDSFPPPCLVLMAINISL